VIRITGAARGLREDGDRFGARTSDAMRDMQADWKHWSRAERAAALLLATLASFAVGTLCYLQI